MRFTQIIFILLLNACTTAQAQASADIIKTIRKDFQAINSDSTLKKISLENEEFLENMTDGGGELTGFFIKDSIVKIVEWIEISYGNRTREFYFKNGKLFFVYEKFDSFILNKAKDGLDLTKTKTSFEGRYYFNNKKLIAKKITAKRPFENNSGDISNELLKAASENIKLLTKKK